MKRFISAVKASELQEKCITVHAEWLNTKTNRFECQLHDSQTDTFICNAWVCYNPVQGGKRIYFGI